MSEERLLVSRHLIKKCISRTSINRRKQVLWDMILLVKISRRKELQQWKHRWWTIDKKKIKRDRKTKTKVELRKNSSRAALLIVQPSSLKKCRPLNSWQRVISAMYAINRRKRRRVFLSRAFVTYESRSNRITRDIAERVNTSRAMQTSARYPQDRRSTSTQGFSRGLFERFSQPRVSHGLQTFMA